ncbi:gp53-like domain-containing protein [Roseomonas sp. USHLN139]|uniref:gp53-like domain-containing protein n=1 Tax=Roseomonas sp. USHLN139 TaxID=3081298 RepID=UPI003B01CF31
MKRIQHTTAAAALPAVPSLGGTLGFFTEGDPVGGIPATVVPAWWLNGIQEELAGIIEAAGLTPLASDNTQVLTALRRLMAGGGYLGVTGNLGVTIAHMGRLVAQLSTVANSTFTLPAASAYPDGGRVAFINLGTFSVTVQRSGSDVIRVGGAAGGATANSMLLRPGDTLELLSDGSAAWLPCGGSAHLPFVYGFGSSQGGSGWQRLPSGLLIQWGTGTGSAAGGVSVTFPMAFPTNLFDVQATNITAVSSVAHANVYSRTLGGFLASMACANTAGSGADYYADSFHWFAVGN